jgi:hypothetical protein
MLRKHNNFGYIFDLKLELSIKYVQKRKLRANFIKTMELAPHKEQKGVW